MEPGRERFLKRALKPVLGDYDFIVIDSPPSKGILTYNAILAADFLVIPTECTNKGVMGAVSTVILVKELEELGSCLVPKRNFPQDQFGLMLQLPNG
jgi:chromosome partitioning protein